MAEDENKRFFEGGSDVELLIFLLHVPMHFPVWCHDIPSLFLKIWVLFLELVNLMMGGCSTLVMLDKTSPAYARLT